MIDTIERFLESDTATYIVSALVGALIALGLVWAVLSTMEVQQ